MRCCAALPSTPGRSTSRERLASVVDGGVVLGGGAVVRADLVIGADGATSTTAETAGLVDRRRVLWGFAVRGYVPAEVPLPVIALWNDRPRHGFPGYGWLFPGPDGANIGLGIGLGHHRDHAHRAQRELEAFRATLGAPRVARRLGSVAGAHSRWMAEDGSRRHPTVSGHVCCWSVTPPGWSTRCRARGSPRRSPAAGPQRVRCSPGPPMQPTCIATGSTRRMATGRRSRRPCMPASSADRDESPHLRQPSRPPASGRSLLRRGRSTGTTSSMVPARRRRRQRRVPSSVWAGSRPRVPSWVARCVPTSSRSVIGDR